MRVTFLSYFCIFWLALLHNSKADAARHDKDIQKDEGITARVQSAMGILGRAGDVEGRLGMVMTAFQNDASKIQQTTKELVDALNDGFDPAPLVAKLRSVNSVEDENGIRSVAAGWKLGTWLDRSKLCDFIFVKQRELEKSSPETAVKYARAAFVLTALEVEANGAVVHLSPSEVNLDERAKLTTEQAASLHKVCDDYEKKMAAETAVLLQFRKVMFAALKEKNSGPLPVEQVGSALKLANDAWQKTETVPGQLALIYYLTWFDSKAKLRHDEAATRQIRNQVKAWSDEAKDKPIEFWLKQSLDRIGNTTVPA